MTLYKPGTSKSVTGVDNVRPPMTASASGFCNSAPDPKPNASGSKPNNVQNVVIKIGRSRIRPAWQRGSYGFLELTKRIL